jgi:REP element-mobilizing transposase RayT
MSPLVPIYTLENCRTAYQLNWSLSIFWLQPPSPVTWLEALQMATEPDGVRVLNHRFAGDKLSQFLVSTKPEVSPHALVRSVKGRLQYLLRGERPKALQRNYSLRSVGSVTRNQLCDKLVDLSRERHGDHAIYWYNLHIVLVHAERITDIREEQLLARREMIIGVCRKQGYLLSRAGVLADHVHLTLGGAPSQSPGEIALRFMNNLAYQEGMNYVGTFGEYDLGAIPRE